VKVESLTPLGVEEVEYRSVLVAFDADDPFSEETVATALVLAERRRRAIHVLSLVTVPANLPLDASIDGQDAAARSKIEQAKLICGQRVSASVEHVRLGQAGNAIVNEAKAIDAAAIVMPLRYRNGAPLYGKTLQTVLAKRPCRVIVAAHPGEAADGSPVGGKVA
jgi:APA family basic amino acid/polyamine antiporter